MDFKYVYKICSNEDWSKAKKNGNFEGSKIDKEDGFIHFSDKEQLKETFNKHFSNQNNLILLKIDALKLKNLIYEQTSDGNLFPHLYEPFKVVNVVAEYEIKINEKGTHNIPIELL